MDFVLEQKNDVSILYAPERLEAAVSIEFRKKILNIVNAGSYKLVIEMSQTDFIDSNGISSLVARIHACRSNQGDVRLVNVQPKIQDILEITNLNKIFHTYQKIDDAVKSFSDEI